MEMSLSLSNNSSSGDLKTIPTSTVLNVDSLTVQGDGTGVHNGNLVNLTVNQYIVPNGSDLDVNADVFNELVTDAFKFNSDTTKEFFKERPSGSGAAKFGRVYDWWNSARSRIKPLTRYFPKVPKRFHKLTAVLLFISIVVVVGSVLFSVIALQQTSAVPTNVSSLIVTRHGWGAQNATGAMDNNTIPLVKVIVAHTAEDSCSLTSECIALVENYQKAEQESGFSDIAYNFLIGGDGKAYEGRGWLVEGAHTKNYNEGSLGVAFIGTYSKAVPGAAMVQAFHELMNLSLALEYLSTDYDLLGQCQLKVTASPGLALIEEMTTWPHFDKALSYENCD